MEQSERSTSNAGLSMAISWTVIILFIATILGLHALSGAVVEESREDPVGLQVLKLQGRHLVGAGHLSGRREGPSLYAQAKKFNTGTIPQRLRFAALAGEMVGPDEALEVLDELGAVIDERDDIEFTPEEQEVFEALRQAYLDYEKEQWGAPSLSADQREVLREELDWFGALALAPPQTDDLQAREEVMDAAKRTTLALVGGAILASVAGLGGFVGLVLMLVFAFTGRLRSRVGRPIAHGHIYIETFALWLIVFTVLGFIVDFLPIPQNASLFAGVIMMFLSLIVLAWPVIRGVPWTRVRHDIGWRWGDQPALEPIIGVGCYAMALPILGVGFVFTLLLMAIQGGFAPQTDAADHFGPTGGAAHPIIQFVSEEGWWGRLQILLVASIAAPVVEETLFRGVLYRHLRSISHRFGFAASIAFSALFNGLIFAAIHPQGWVAIPALGSLAFAMSLAREWRGTLIPSMVMHGVSNGAVMLLMMIALG